VLSGVFGFHPIAVRDCVERNHGSKVHIYPDYVFSVLHAPKVGKRGHVHYVELDQFVAGTTWSRSMGHSIRRWRQRLHS
jgi:magnesium transporter